MECMEDDIRPNKTASGSTGDRATPEDRGWSPLTALEILTANKVADWRTRNQMNDDSDFAFRWSSHTQAITEAGHAVAHAWLQVRSEQQDLLWPAAAKMVDELPKPTPSQAPKLQQAFFGPKSKKRQAKQKRAPVRLRANPSESPDAIQSRVDALASVLQQLGAIRPSGRMSEQLEEEWAGSCVRLAQRLVTSAEPVTVLNALKTHQELRSYMAKRERQGEPERVDLDSFLHSSSTTAPSRALNALKWLNKHGHLGWDVVDLTCPASIRPRSKRGQAAVISPPMLMFLEEQAEQMCRSGDDRWSCLLGSWMVAAGCMRYRHLTRSTPRRVSMSTFHATCHRGKQRFTRKGFDFSLPGEFASGFSWSRQWLIRYEALSEKQRKTAGLCFNKDGIPWTLSDVTTEAQYLFANYLTDASTPGLNVTTNATWWHPRCQFRKPQCPNLQGRDLPNQSGHQFDQNQCSQKLLHPSHHQDRSHQTGPSCYT